MAQTLEGIKGGERLIKVGATGTISKLMMRELDQIPVVPQMLPVPATATARKQPQRRKSLDEACSSSRIGSINIINLRSSGIAPKAKLNGRDTPHRIPMLGPDSFPVDRSPIIRKKNDKKKSNIVEVVDIKCGSNPDKAWATPISNSLKKLGFSKLSESII